MTHRLLLLRHGKSDWKAGTDDWNRPLKDRGKRGAQRIGLYLAQQKIIPDYVLSSPAERALATAQKCCKVMGVDVDRIKTDERLYLAAPETLLQVLSDCPAQAGCVLMVGHNPGLADLLDYLSDTPVLLPPDGKLMPTATLAHLELSGTWEALHTGSANLLSLTRGRSLPKTFSYPSPDSEEQRERPAYYYTQSSAIPYRVNQGKPEILITRSSQNKHWVIPKGIAEPGMSLHASAAKEAWEEAGVEGEIDEQPIGVYEYPKWGAQCTVSVYPMLVSRTLNDEYWPEHHRGRQWMSPNQAAGMLKQREIAPMILALAARLLQT